MAIDGNDLLILAGPTLNLDGPVAIYRWEGALDATGESLVPREDLEKVLDVPYGLGKDRGRDHAEGLLRLSKHRAARTQMLIVYDSPACGRRVGDFACPRRCGSTWRLQNSPNPKPRSEADAEALLATPTIDYPRLIEMLRRRGYDGWLSFEYEAAEKEATGIPRALGYLRRLVESPVNAAARAS